MVRQARALPSAHIHGREVPAVTPAGAVPESPWSWSVPQTAADEARRGTAPSICRPAFQGAARRGGSPPPARAQVLASSVEAVTKASRGVPRKPGPRQFVISRSRGIAAAQNVHRDDVGPAAGSAPCGTRPMKPPVTMLMGVPRCMNAPVLCLRRRPLTRAARRGVNLFSGRRPRSRCSGEPAGAFRPGSRLPRAQTRVRRRQWKTPPFTSDFSEIVEDY